MTKPTASELERRESTFWDYQARSRAAAELSGRDVSLDRAYDRPRLQRLGRVHGKSVLDVGCGTGRWSTYLAQQGAVVTAVDISRACLDVAKQRAALHGVADRVHACAMSATALAFADHTFDLVHGLDVLHHVRAPDLGEEIARVLKPAGRAVFGENSANNPLLMWLRTHLCGRWGIPKWSSADEHPLRAAEISEFARHFRRCDVEYPDFRFFHYLDAKVFNHRREVFRLFCRGLDLAVYRSLPALRPYSYRQLIVCTK